MRQRFGIQFFLLLGATMLFMSCQEIINYPAPTLVSLAPNNINAGHPTFTLTVTGDNLTPASTIFWNNLPLASTVFVSQNIMTATITPGFLTNPGQVSVQVETPQPGGGLSQVLTFTINPNNSGIPAITSINPTSVTAGSSGATIFVNGSNFDSLSTVSVNGSNRPTTVSTPSTLSATLTSSDLATAGTLQIEVISPPPGGGTSNPVNLVVTNPFPSISGVTPNASLAGSAAPNLNISGSSFVSNSYITINGVARQTTFAGSTTLATQLTAADVAVGGINQIRVVNPPPGGGTSNMLVYAVNPTASVGLPVLLDLDPNGNPAIQGVCGTNCTNGIPTLTTAGPSIDSTGSLAAFASSSNNLLLAQQTTTSAIFLRTTCLGLGTSCTPKTSIINLTSSGGIPNGPSWEPSVDSSAGHVAFTSEATNLVTTSVVPTGVKEIYWEPVCTATSGCNSGNGATTTLVSVAPDGVTAGNGDSYDPVLSPDGQYVAFVSLATNLVSNVFADGVTPQVYIRATCGGVTTTGCIPTTYLVSSPDLVTPGNGPSSSPAISNDGLYVSFTSTATNLGATAPNPGGGQEIFTRTTCVTTLSESTNTCTPITNISSTPDGVTPAGGTSLDSSVSSDGRFIVFASTGTNLGTPSGGVQEIYARDTCTGVTLTTCTPSTILISTVDGITPANGMSESPRINGCGGTTSGCTTGQIIAFASKATNLGLNVSNGVENIFVRKACLVVATNTTCTTATTLASQAEGGSPPPSNGNSIVPVLSGDGHSVAFISFANDLVPFPTSGFEDIYLAATQF